MSGQAVPPGFHHRPKGAALVSDLDDGTKADIDLPSPSKDGAIAAPKGADGKPLANGDAAHAEEEDAWGKTGWEPRFGWPKDIADEGQDLLDHATLLESQLSEKFFGGGFWLLFPLSHFCTPSKLGPATNNRAR